MRLPDHMTVTGTTLASNHVVFDIEVTETTHRCPPDGEGTMPCCGRTPFEVPRSGRMTEDASLVNCGSR